MRKIEIYYIVVILDVLNMINDLRKKMFGEISYVWLKKLVLFNSWFLIKGK